MGIGDEFEAMTKMIMDYEVSERGPEILGNMITELECVCVQACEQLETELKKIDSCKTKAE
jgi:hypothetical protein